MYQYLDLLQTIKEKGTHKPPAREGMPSSLSLFGYQFRHDLQEGFPLLTTKKMFWKGVVVELLWFLRGDTNIKYLVDNGCNLWNEDAYNYYVKKCREENREDVGILQFEDFIELVKEGNLDSTIPNYKVGDCDNQYGKLWRSWEAGTNDGLGNYYPLGDNNCGYVDQIKDLIDGLKKNPMGRRHIITAWNPTTLDKMALNACHVLVQFNCRPLSDLDRKTLLSERPEWEGQFANIDEDPSGDIMETIDEVGIPKYYLDCQLYQRSADVFLGVPFNIASYALLAHIISRICNMVPGEFIHTFGDVHIYDNHMNAVNEQLTREPRKLPKLVFSELVRWNCIDDGGKPFEPIELFKEGVLGEWEFSIQGYNPYPKIKAELSTGMKK
jgi:thymidylate synthase